MPLDLETGLMELRRSILAMGAQVEQRVTYAVDSLIKRDHEAAMLVRSGDGEIDDMEIDIEEECLRLLALQQPVAGDLRFVLSVMRINHELERIGDLAKGVAKRTLDMDRLAPIRLPDSLIAMGRESKRMVSDALGALADDDVTTARRIRRDDQRVDDLQREIFAWAQEEIPRHVEVTAAAIDVLSIARRFERIADHATNIAEDVIFLIEGRLVRHGEIK